MKSESREPRPSFSAGNRVLKVCIGSDSWWLFLWDISLEPVVGGQVRTCPLPRIPNLVADSSLLRHCWSVFWLVRSMCSVLGWVLSWGDMVHAGEEGLNPKDNTIFVLGTTSASGRRWCVERRVRYGSHVHLQTMRSRWKRWKIEGTLAGPTCGYLWSDFLSFLICGRNLH